MVIVDRFKYPHHNQIATILNAIDSACLRENNILFAGGTLLTLSLGEYRQSDDIYFLVKARSQGLKNIRDLVRHSFKPLFPNAPEYLEFGEARADQYRIFGTVTVSGNLPIKIEVFCEARIGQLYPDEGIDGIPVPTLNMRDMAVQKLFANADRYHDRYVHHRDLYDLAVLTERGIDLPAEINRAEEVYSVEQELREALCAIESPAVRDRDFHALAIKPEAQHRIITGLNKLRAPLGMKPLQEADQENDMEPDLF
jgi:predicted nucleotidyltransferase component of viral defense system